MILDQKNLSFVKHLEMFAKKTLKNNSGAQSSWKRREKC